MNQRKYLPTLSELIDRLSITQLKEVFITNSNCITNFHTMKIITLI